LAEVGGLPIGQAVPVDDGPGILRLDAVGEEITTERLLLTPLRPDDADEMVEVLGDERLHEFIGGRPAALEELRERYAALVEGSPDSGERWLNWIVRRRSDVRPLGTVQATLTDEDGRWVAEVAWVVGVAWQGQGFASESASALVDRLRRCGVTSIAAHVHPDHLASAVVAERAGLRPTAEEVDGERVWRMETSGVPPRRDGRRFELEAVSFDKIQC
jgi:RimJ/RimL family protein N-acetyltransferase